MRHRDDQRNRRRLAAVAAVLVLAAAACGGGGDSEEDAARPTTTAAGAAKGGSTKTAAAAKPAGDDQALADAAILQPSDLPAGFVASDGGEADEEGEDPFASCSEKSSALSAQVTARSTGPELSNDVSSASAGAMVFRDVGAARAAMDELESDAITDCVNDSLTEQAAMGDEGIAELMGTAFTSASAPDVGDDATAYRLEIAFPAMDEAVGGEETTEEMTIAVDMVFARQGRVVGMYAFTGLGETIAAAEQEAALTRALARAAAAQA